MAEENNTKNIAPFLLPLGFFNQLQTVHIAAERTGRGSVPYLLQEAGVISNAAIVHKVYRSGLTIALMRDYMEKGSLDKALEDIGVDSDTARDSIALQLKQGVGWAAAKPQQTPSGTRVMLACDPPPDVTGAVNTPSSELSKNDVEKNSAVKTQKTAGLSQKDHEKPPKPSIDAPLPPPKNVRQDEEHESQRGVSERNMIMGGSRNEIQAGECDGGAQDAAWAVAEQFGGVVEGIVEHVEASGARHDAVEL